MPLPSIKQLLRTTKRVFNPEWKERALRGRRLRESVTRFQHRAIYKHLDRSILQMISDDDLIQAVVDFVELKLPQGHTGPVPNQEIPFACACVYYYRTMDYEVWNGGFDQFLTGSDENSASRAMEALRYLELPEVADVIGEAARLFGEGKSTIRCDYRYEDVQPEAERKIVRFIREHPDEFTTRREL